jgi:hypothetical protein
MELMAWIPGASSSVAEEWSEVEVVAEAEPEK